MVTSWPRPADSRFWLVTSFSHTLKLGVYECRRRERCTVTKIIGTFDVPVSEMVSPPLRCGLLTGGR
jgi:hypothetical protein